MVDTGELAKYLNDKSCKEGDICKIVGEGEIVEIEDGNRKKKILNIPVEIQSSKRILTYTPGSKALRIVQEAWGFESTSWMGKQFRIAFVLMQVGKNEINVIKPVPLI